MTSFFARSTAVMAGTLAIVRPDRVKRKPSVSDNVA
jgi:hypothetical protein